MKVATKKSGLILAVALALALAGRAQAGITWNLAGGGVWDTSTPNWTGDSTTFTDDGTVNVTFNNPAGGTITIAPDMSPASTTVSAGSGTYTFTGGTIDSGWLDKSGEGTLNVNNATVSVGQSFAVWGGALQVTGGGVVNVGVIESNGGEVYFYSTDAISVDATSRINFTAPVFLRFRNDTTHSMDFANTPTAGKVSVVTSTSLSLGDYGGGATMNLGAPSGGTQFGDLQVGGGGRGVLNVNAATIGFLNGVAMWDGGGLNLTGGAVVNIGPGGNGGEEYFYSTDAISVDAASQINFTAPVVLRFRNNSVNRIAFAGTPTPGRVSVPAGTVLSLGDYGGGATLTMTGPVTFGRVTLGGDGAGVLQVGQANGQTDGLTLGSSSTGDLIIGPGSRIALVFDGSTGRGALEGSPSVFDWALRWSGNHVADLLGLYDAGKLTITAPGSFSKTENVFYSDPLSGGDGYTYIGYTGDPGTILIVQ